mmetsp:Transcript_6789/g.13862  ORF Transcript_6789/g.13862 Transcript_6789/m.13862 type:complete len:594 (-) Transcript_6789:101-1882(-)
MTLRKRRNHHRDDVPHDRDAPEKSTKDDDTKVYQPSQKVTSIQHQKSPSQSFLVTKFAILRLVGFVYFIAFYGAYRQNPGLMGSNGLLPAHSHFDRLRSQFQNPIRGFLTHPSIFWFILDSSASVEDWHMDAVAIAGMALSSLVVLGLDSWLIMSLLWLLDFTIVTLAEGTSFYSYGWESQLLETGFLSIWLCDLPTQRWRDGNKPHFRGLFMDAEGPSPPSLAVLWLFRWLCARISIGAGLIKLRGGSCWKNKTCLYYHFETQPIPSPMSFIFHFLPKSVLRRAVDLDFFVQLYSIWLVFLPGVNEIMTNLRRMGGFIQAGFMINIIISGNFAFLNHLTIIPALACLDDECYPGWLKTFVRRKHLAFHHNPNENSGKSFLSFRNAVDLVLFALVTSLSVPVVSNLLQISGKHQAMNASFHSLRLVNTYGAFGSVGEKRYEAIISVSNDGRNWTEIEFPCKPGSIQRRPCFCAPYHYRLDWNIWFIGFKPHQSMLQRRENWLFRLIQKILTDEEESSRPWMALLDASSVESLQQSPKFAKVDMYHYEMAGSLWVIAANWLEGKAPVWWKRRYEEPLIKPVTVDPSGHLAYAII